MQEMLDMGDYVIALDDKKRFIISPLLDERTKLGELKLLLHHEDGRTENVEWSNILTSMHNTGLVRANVGDDLIFSVRVGLLKDLKTFDVSIDIASEREPFCAAVECILIMTGEGGTMPRWLVPGFFYKENRPENCNKIYPRYSPDESNPDKLVSPWWRFRSDRAADPIVFCWTENRGGYIGVEERCKEGMMGLGFSGESHQEPSLSAWCPWREEPAKYSSIHADKNAPAIEFMTISPEKDVHFRFFFGFTDKDFHSYADVLRFRYEEHVKMREEVAQQEPEERLLDIIPPKESNWVDLSRAADLAVEGLLNFHYNETEAMLYETCSFDKYFSKGDGYVDRCCMHTSWISGAPVAYSLLWYGHERNNENAIKAARNVLDKITSTFTPIGTLWGRFVEGEGWDTGWNPQPDWIHSRTLAEACLFLLRAIQMEQTHGSDRVGWLEAVKKTIEYVLKIQREDGNFGTYYNVQSGNVEEWDGAGGVLWIPALILAQSVFNIEAYSEAAEKAGNFYERYLEDEFLYGAPEDVHLTPTSEDGYDFLLAYMHLYQTRFLKRWLTLASRAADWLLTFRFAYDVHFPENTILHTYDYRTFGGDVASPSNIHIHCYGLVCHPELKKLSIYVEDDYYKNRAMDHLVCSLQGLAREDGDMNARRGMISEQFYYTDWWQPKGSMLQLSHAWCLGLILYASLFETSEAGLETVFR